nr:immunoglobulin heavy chain junction region [Homo sapiens]
EAELCDRRRHGCVL